MDHIQDQDLEFEEKLIAIYEGHTFEKKDEDGNEYRYVGKSSLDEFNSKITDHLNLEFLGRGNNKAVYALSSNEDVVLAVPFIPMEIKDFETIYACNLIMGALYPNVPAMYNNPLLNSDGKVLGIYKQRVHGQAGEAAEKKILEKMRRINQFQKNNVDPLAADPSLTHEFISGHEIFTMNYIGILGLNIFVDQTIEEWMLGNNGVPYYVDEFYIFDSMSEAIIRSIEYIEEPNFNAIFEVIRNRQNHNLHLDRFFEGWRILEAQYPKVRPRAIVSVL